MIDNPFEMVVLIVLITAFAGVMRARFKSRGPSVARIDDAETRQLREEVRNLRERLSVLERITVEKENSLAREIESLRDQAPGGIERL